MLQLLHNHCVLRARAGLLRCARAHTTCACTSLGARARRHCRMRSAPAPKALARARTCPRGEYSPRELLHARRCRLPSGCAFIPLVPPKGGLRRKRSCQPKQRKYLNLAASTSPTCTLKATSPLAAQKTGWSPTSSILPLVTISGSS